MRPSLIRSVALVAVPLAACSVSPHPKAASSPTAETITVAVGPCFGFCPVYATTVTPEGFIRFEGQRHTAVLGERTRNVGAATYRALTRDLATIRPATGTEAVLDCAAAVSDTSPYTVTWTDAAGRKTVAMVESGCPGGQGRELVERLRDLPDRLGVAAWAKQMTRPGAPRGRRVRHG